MLPTTLTLVSKKEDVRKKWGVGDHIAICEAVWTYLNEHRSASEELQAIHDAGKPALKEIITKKNNTWFRQGGKNKASLWSRHVRQSLKVTSCRPGAGTWGDGVG